LAQRAQVAAPYRTAPGLRRGGPSLGRPTAETEVGQTGHTREAHELIALALALADEGRPDDDVVAALVAAAEGHTLRLQSAYASTLYLVHELPFDQRAHDLTATFLKALERVAAREGAHRDGAADTAWLGDREQPEPTRAFADRLARATGDHQTVLRNARRLQADLDRLREG
jgi:hypothetical protein